MRRSIRKFTPELTLSVVATDCVEHVGMLENHAVKLAILTVRRMPRWGCKVSIVPVNC